LELSGRAAAASERTTLKSGKDSSSVQVVLTRQHRTSPTTDSRNPVLGVQNLVKRMVLAGGETQALANMRKQVPVVVCDDYPWLLTV
jgi:hypothetical protein